MTLLETIAQAFVARVVIAWMRHTERTAYHKSAPWGVR